MKSINKPTLYMLIGLPASGKSSYVKKELGHCRAHSSDDIREEFLKDVNSQENNNLVFEVLHNRVKNDLVMGYDTVYDATNISYKRRMTFLQQLKKINFNKVALLFATPYEKCLEQNRMRDRVVPEHVIKRMYLNFDIPAYFEGWDDIEIIWNLEGTEIDEDLMDKLKGFNQENSHHKLTLGNHCIECSENIKKYFKSNNASILDSSQNLCLYTAGYYHDIGKIFTKSFKNGKGEVTTDAHYLQHHHVSAYESLFRTEHHWFAKDEILDISQLIRWHMYPYNIKEEKTKNKLIKLVGKEFYDRLMILHEADKLAH